MIYYCKTSFIYDVSVSSFTNKERTGLYFDQSSIQRKIYYHNSNESSASIHICIPPSRYSVAYSRGLSIATAFKAHSEHGVEELSLKEKAACITGQFQKVADGQGVLLKLRKKR